ncbi:MAG: methyltransferase [Armatimonadota bacterium]|nr:methyltransferase [Armatimonadota bacterium]MDR7433504.1 methyltransferase [Armatimonadota bacterium]
MRTKRDVLTILALIGTAAALAGLFIGIGHSLIVWATGRVRESDLAITRGRWDLVAVSIAAFMAFLALIPVRIKRDWRAHGIYVAFIISLFAEMFGFPLTVYFLSTAFGLTVFEKKFMLYMLRIGMPIGSLITFLGVLLVLLGWREVYRAKDRLATQGIYRYLRHPQYLGILLVTAGWLVHWPTIPGLVMWPILALLYYRLALQEDRYLAGKFGEEFWTYAKKTPMFLPLRVIKD